MPSMRSMRTAALAFALIGSGCSSAEAAGSPAGQGVVAFRPTSSTTTTAIPTTSSTTSGPIEPQVAPECAVASAQIYEKPPVELIESLSVAVTGLNLPGLDVGISIWVDGWGEVLSHNADQPLVPASNQKLLVAIAALDRLGGDHKLVTSVGTRGDDLVLAAGADPTLTSTQLNQLAKDVRSAGVATVDRLVVDATGYPQGPRALGWFDWQIPTYVGPLSGFMVDDNRWNREPSFVSNPLVGNGEIFAEQLVQAGVNVEGEVTVANEPIAADNRIASVTSPRVEQLVKSMLRSSDNQIADLLALELGRVAGRGDLRTGLRVVDDVLGELCVGPTGTSDDGSGLSRSNMRSPREFRRILEAIRNTPVGDELRAALPIAGVSGTLRNRFAGTAYGRVQAKTGTIIGGRALSGYAQTIGKREVVFSIIVNGEPEAASASLGAIDYLVAVVAATSG